MFGGRKLQHTSFMTASLSKTDFFGADHAGSCLFYAHVSDATYTSRTFDQENNLLKACALTATSRQQIVPCYPKRMVGTCGIRFPFPALSEMKISGV
jgi:hypothetical protein